MYIYLTEILTVQCDTHENTSKLTATITWSHQNDETSVNRWKLRVRNLTWTQNDYDYDEKEFECNAGAFTR